MKRIQKLLVSEKSQFLSTLLCLVFIIIGVLFENVVGAWHQLPFAIAILFGGFKQTKKGISEIIEDRVLNVDLLMILGSIGACVIGDWLEGAMLTFIFCLSGALEEYTMNKSKREISSLMKMQPTTATLFHESGRMKVVDVSQLRIQDLVMVAKGESIPIDGIVVQGLATIDESMLSGEAIPVEKSEGDEVFAGTINQGNAIKIEVTRKTQDTMFAKILKLVENAQNEPTSTASFIEKIENIYVKVVLCVVPLMILLVHFLLNWSWHDSFYRGMVLLVVASPCALVASATPATLATISNLAKRGVLFKGGKYLELMEQLKAIAFDKTGTLTVGKPKVVEEKFYVPKKEVLPILLAIEVQSTHPLAFAIMEKYPLTSYELPPITSEEKEGFGLIANIQGVEYKVGRYVANDKQPEINKEVERMMQDGETIICMTKNGEVQVVLGVLDVEKKEAKSSLQYFASQGIQTTMLTGDNLGVGQAIAKKIGIQKIYANLLPQDKTRRIQEQKDEFKVNAMVGDGINDAPALATATVGIAMGEGSDIAMDVADVVLMNNDLQNLVKTHQLSKEMKKIIQQNICFSLAVIALLILSNFLQLITLPLGVVGHEGSTILVILNGLRMLRK